MELFAQTTRDGPIPRGNNTHVLYALIRYCDVSRPHQDSDTTHSGTEAGSSLLTFVY
ncbi:hypothetical protein BDZ89DRAFT_1069545 [Hymenopellis radicata]|nr:hypothetical protein BDZ89DRAFT_1069545 [Hymenopellis radicata]